MVSEKDNKDCAQYFGSIAEKWTSLYKTKAQFKDRLELFVKKVIKNVPKSGKILDFGCGPGNLSFALAQEGYEVTGVDAAEHMIQIANQQLTQTVLTKLNFQVMKAENVTMPRESFDAVVCSSVIEYIEYDKKFLKDLIGLLKPGGVLLISVPHNSSFWGKFEDALKWIPFFKIGPGRRDLKYSKRRYKIKELQNFIQDFSFEIAEYTYFEFPLFGKLGIKLSRLRNIGVMVLVVAVKKKHTLKAANSTDFSAKYDFIKTDNNVLDRKKLWEQTSPSVKKLISVFFLVLPNKAAFGKKFYNNINFLSSVEWRPSEQVRQYQLETLREILNIAYEKTKFYRQMFDSVGFNLNDFDSLDYLRKLPTINKQTIIDNLSDICTKNINENNVDYVSTGGTSGIPLNFYINAGRSAIEYAYLISSWERAGYKLGMPMAVLRGRIVRPDKNGLFHEYDPILKHHYYSSFHLTEENMARYLKHITTIGQCFLHVYPSSASTLAKFILRSGRHAPKNIRGIISESEIVYPEQRQMVEEVFGCRLFSCYGQSEKVVLAAECEKSDNYHIWPTYGYFELLDDEGNPVTTPGQRGEIVGTGFINTVMPFIRYRTGDLATYVDDHCSICGREHILISDIQGHRVQEVLIADDGSEISWTALNMHDDTFLNVRQFQFMQEKPGRAVLRIVPADGYLQYDTEKIQRNLGNKLNGRVTFSIELVKEIPLSERGKAIYVDQRIPRDNLRI
ncbi:MAG: methyltransferase domain-containing protein [Sedimentisphaerales bacterium]|nr:methyltransferase domain-containing protein [Sedimentisphaerales bacterium]